MRPRRTAALATFALAASALGATAEAAKPSGLPVLAAPVVAIPALQGTLPGGLSASYLAGSAQSEPRVHVGPTGTVLVSAQAQARDCLTGVTVSKGWHDCVWRSTDQGGHFALSGGGKDTGSDVDFVSLPSGTLLYATLANNDTLGSGFPGVAVLRSTDDGRSWSSTVLNGFMPLADREWLTVIGDEVVLTFTAPPGNVWVSRSTDDGQSFGLPQPISNLPPQAVLSPPGAPTFDAARGELVVPYEAATSSDVVAADTISVSGDVTLHVARSADKGLTWTDEVVDTYSQRQGVPVIAADAKGREYVVVPTANANGQLCVSFWRNDGRGGPWTPASRISAPTSSAFLSWVVARGDGGVAAAWLDTPHPDGDTASRAWNVRLVTSGDAGRTWTGQDASQGVVYTGSQFDSAAVVFDLFGLTVDARGMLHLAFVRQTEPVATPNLVRIDYVRQVDGPPLGGRR